MENFDFEYIRITVLSFSQQIDASFSPRDFFSYFKTSPRIRRLESSDGKPLARDIDNSNGGAARVELHEG